jgi:hypothetical protein
MVGASVATGISIIILNIVMLLEVYKLMKMHPYNGKFIKPAIFAIFAFGIILFIKNVILDFHGGLLQLLICISLFVGIFMWLICKWGIDDKDKFVVDIFKKKVLKVIT